jgi:hypothetical protein
MVRLTRVCSSILTTARPKLSHSPVNFSRLRMSPILSGGSLDPGMIT